jgi:cytidylate kinase
LITETKSFVVTISRQLGSGGGFIGERLSARLKALYLDREIVRRAAEKLKVSEEELEILDEKNTPFWESILLSSNYVTPTLYSPPMTTGVFPMDQDLFRVEKEIITRIAEKNTAVIVGRGGSYILRGHPRHASLYLHADISVRCERIQAKYKLTVAKALKMIQENDKSRSRYLHNVTGIDWSDARQYHLCIDTGVTELPKVENLVIDYLQSRFGPLELTPVPNIEVTSKG